MSENNAIQETVQVGYFEKIKNSIGGVIFGILLFIGAIVLLFWNEGKVNLGLLAEQSLPINIEVAVDSSKNGKMVAATGKILSEEIIGDSLFLKPDKYLQVNRNVEMFAWEEDSSTSTKKKLGGSEEQVTTYTYSKIWTSFPDNSGSFKEPAGHENPEMIHKDLTTKVSNAKMGNYNIDIVNLGLADSRILPIREEILIDTAKDKYDNLSGNYIYLSSQPGQTSTASPLIGDTRISYSVVDNGLEGTVIGKLSGSTITEFTDKNGNKLFKFAEGNRDDAINKLKSENELMTWGFRALGFVLMFVGLNMIAGPVSVILDFIPFFGNVSRSVIGFITFIIAAVLSIATIIISVIVHNLILLIVIGVVLLVLTAGIIAGTALLLRKKQA